MATHAPPASPVEDYLRTLLATCRQDRSGAVADYIPELADADPEWMGICLATIDGHVYEVGDTRQPFTLQSMSKPFVYGMALEDTGPEGVSAKIGVEPSGDAFNSISLDPETGRPLNPMINAGAIAATSLVGGDGPSARFDRILSTLSRFAGRELELDAAVYRSEHDTGHRNRAIGHMLRTFEILEGDPEDTLDVYFRQCAVSLDCRDLSLMAATLANGGVHPVTGVRALSADLVPTVLSVMTTCGMYDEAGNWMVTVGLPAKSGVTGGILALLPGQIGIAVFSPRLDPRGNSVRGVQACRALSADLDLHFLRSTRPAHVAIGARRTVDAFPSRRRRPESERELLDRVGDRGAVFELQGDLLFAGAEHVVRSVMADWLDVAVVDLRDAEYIDRASVRLLRATAARLRDSDEDLAFVERPDRPHLDADHDGLGPVLTFPDDDRAREWCEERLLARYGSGAEAPDAVTLAEHRICRGLGAADLDHLASVLEPRTFATGERIAAIGEPATEIFLLMRGAVTSSLPASDGTRRRLSTMTPGWAIGEVAVLGESTRTVDSHGDGDGTLLVLPAAGFHALADTRPGLHAALVRNMLMDAYALAAQLTREIGG